jgi:hypothetical protein
MKDAQSPGHVSLGTLVQHLKEGRFVIPDFQRDFEWTPQDIRDLMRSLFLDYYIGSLLLWKGTPENFDALSCEPIFGFEGATEAREHIVLDGQQRLTAIHYAFAAPKIHAPNRAGRYVFFVHIDKFRDEAYDDAFGYERTKTGIALLDDPVSQWDRHMFPLAVIGQGGFKFHEWVHGYAAHWKAKAEEATSAGDQGAAEEAQRHAAYAVEFGEYVQGIREQYQVSYIALDSDLAIDKVCDIFTQVNSKGVKLDIFDLINAMVKPKKVKLKDMWRRAEPRLEFVGSNRMNVYVLQVMSILKQSYCSPKYLYNLLPGHEKTVRDSAGAFSKEKLVADSQAFEDLWNRSVTTLEKAIADLRHPQEFGALSSQYLPYVAIIPVFAALQERARQLPASQQLSARRKISHWYWASVFTNRYSGSVESTAARDFNNVSNWFVEDLAEPQPLAEFRLGFRDLNLRNEVKRGTSVYNGIFNLFVLNGARDWMTGALNVADNLDDHHIVPKDWGNQQKLDSSIDSILNRAPLTSETNRHVINNKLPNAYLPELIEKNGENEVRSIFESHLISPAAFDLLLADPFTPEHFEDFLTERQRTIRGAIENLLIKERLDLEPHLRELDAQLEETELRLRALIVTALDGDPSRLPSNVAGRIDERIRAALRRNPGLDPDHLATLAGRLEYSDLRELQDTITNKLLWPLFEERFGTKEQVSNRFDQLAELRNSIRHSRSVVAHLRKDGEAALLWFASALRGAVAAAG